MLTNPITAWLYALMVAAAPPEKLAAQPQIPGHEETVEQKQARYQQIATDLYEVVYDPATVPLFGGARGRAITAATILAVAWHESGFAHDVDVGPCYQGKGFRGRCDGGRSSCSMQLQIGDGTTIEGWTQADLFADRHKCFKAGLRLMRKSQRACGAKFGRDHWLTAYAAGVCDHPVGQLRSRELTALARRFLARPGQPAEADATFLLPPPPSAGPEGDVRSK